MLVLDELKNSGGTAGSLTEDVKKWPVLKVMQGSPVLIRATPCWGNAGVTCSY